MRSVKGRFDAAILSGAHELGLFWLRKTRQPVIAVLVTQKANSAPVFCAPLLHSFITYYLDVWIQGKV